MAAIDQNQYDYLNNLVKQGGGNGEWAKSQLSQNTYTAPKPATTPTSNPITFNPTPYAQGNNYAGSSSSSVPTPAAVTQPAKPQTNNQGQTQLPSWMGNMYQNVPGTDWYSTNPSNPNASKYRADGSPVATVNYDNQQTGQKYDGYATPEQWNQLMGSANNAAGSSSLISNMLSSGQLNMPQSSIYGPNSVYAKASVPNPSSRYNVDAPASDRLAYFKQNPDAAKQEISTIKGMYEAEKAKGATAERLRQISQWADQVRSASGIGFNDATYGNAPDAVYSGGTGGTSTGQLVTGTGVTGQGTGSTTGTGTTKVPAPADFGQMTKAQIEAEAASKINKQITDKTRVANQTKTGFQTSYDRLMSQTKDNRALENFQNSQLLNPFNGFSDYAQGQINREREITDRQGSQDLQSRLANVDIELADFLNQTPEMQQNIINELTRQERDYGVQVGQLTGNFNGQRTVQGQQLDLSAQDQSFNQARQTKTDNWNAYMDSIGLTGNLGSGAKADWSLLGGTDGEPTFDAKTKYLQQEGFRINNEIAKLELANLPAEQKLKMQQLQKQISEIGKAPYKSAVDAEYDKIKLDTAKEQLKQLQNKPSTTTYKQDPGFFDDMASLRTNPAIAISTIEGNRQALLDAYGPDGYTALLKEAEKQQQDHEKKLKDAE